MKKLKFRDAVCSRKLRDALRHILVARDDADEKTKVRELAKWLEVEPEDIEVQSNVDFYVDGEHYIVADYDTAYELAKERVQNFIDVEGLTNFSENFKGEILNYCLDDDALRDMIKDDIYERVADDYDVDEVVDEYRSEWDEEFVKLSASQKAQIIHRYLDDTFAETPKEMYKELVQDAIDNDIDPSIYEGLSDEEILDEYNNTVSGGYVLDSLEDFDTDDIIDIATAYFGFSEQDEKDYLVEQRMSKWYDDPISYFMDMYGDTDEVLKWVMEQHLVDLGEVVERVISWDGIEQQLASYDGYENSLGSDLYAYHDSKRRHRHDSKRRHIKRNHDSVRKSYISRRHRHDSINRHMRHCVARRRK